MENKKTLLAITIPIFLELLLVTVVGNIDTIMLGKYSDNAVASVGGMSQVLLIQNTILSFICLGTTILMAQYIGANNHTSIKRVIATSISMNLIVGIILGIIYYFGWDIILTLIKLPPVAKEIGKDYFRMVGGFCIFQSFTLTVSAILKSYGNTKPMLFVNIFVNCLNIIGNGMFIFGWFNAPILGVTGVGISTIVSRFIGAIISIFILKYFCKIRLGDFIFFSFEKVKKILSIGIPTAGEHLTWCITQLVILSMVNTMGIINITARTYLALISSFIMIFSIALGHGTAIQIGQLVGAKKKEEAYNRGLKSLKISFIAAFILSIIVYLFRYQIIGILTSDEKVIEVSSKIFIWFIFIETGRTFNIVLINALHAAGDIKYPMLVGCFVMLGVAIPLSYLLGVKLHWLLTGIWIGNGVDEWIRGFIMLFRWKSKKWLDKSFV